jgi:Spy/CpxP family protein refolding chaperone
MASTRWMVRLASGLSLLGLSALAGCATTAVGSPVPANAASGDTADDELVADLNEHHRHHHHGGVTMLLALSLDNLGLPPEQQAVVAKIQADLFAGMEPARVGARDVLTALADGMAAGTIDEARVNAAITEIERASGLVHEATVDALNRLHAALTPPQRAALVDKMEAHWAVFRQANAGDEQGAKDRTSGHLAELTADLGLSADQGSQIAASFQARMRAAPGAMDAAAMDAHMQRFAAFRSDTFDAKTLTGGGAVNANLAARGAARMARFYEAAAPVLTPEQRAKLALSLREHAAHKDTVTAAH